MKSKRIFDILFTLLILPPSLPVVLIIFIVQLIELRQFPLFFQWRGLTAGEKGFRMLKFRTLKKSSIDDRPESAQEIFVKKKLKAYVPLFSSWLRRTGLDELPQLFNVLLGQMSLVGPRPLMISDLELIKKFHPSYHIIREKLKMKPGMTGLWQLMGDRKRGIDDLIRFELIYEEEHSVLLDLRVILSTIPVILFASGSDSILERRVPGLEKNILQKYRSINLEKYQKGENFDENP